MHHGVRVHIHVLAVATTQRRGDFERSRAVPPACAITREISLLAEAKVLTAAVFAGATRHVLLESDAIAFLHVPSTRGLGANLGDNADIFVTENARSGRQSLPAVYVTSAYATGLDLQQARIWPDARQLEFAELELFRRDKHRCHAGVCHEEGPL